MDSSLSAQLQELLKKDPIQAREILRQLNAEKSLTQFVRQAWPSIEPAVDLRLGWAIDAICDHLQAVSEGDTRRLLINVPPGMMKSLATCVFLPAWEWGPRDMPHLRYIGTSYAKDLASRDNVRCRDLMMSEWYQERWPIEFKQEGSTYFENTATGWRKSASSGSQLTGFRGDRILVDDPHSVQSAESEARRQEVLYWFAETLPTRLNDMDNSAIIVIMQRLHERDVSGLILEKELGYDHLMLPMEFEPERRCRTVFNGHTFFEDPRQEDGELLFPERFSGDKVEELKKTFRSMGGEYAEAGQLQQRPSPRGGGMFKKDDMQIIERAPVEGVRWCRGWDFAATSGGTGARSAGVKIGIEYATGRVIIAHVIKGRWSSHDLYQKIKNCATADGPNCPPDMPQDPGQAGKAQKAEIARQLQGHVFHFGLESGDKEMRAAPLAAQSEAGNLYLVKGAWNDEFIAEATVFPAGALKDQIDAASRAYARLVMDPLPEIPAAPVTVHRTT
jgi:predicted phage terminase large subunit-like protein